MPLVLGAWLGVVFALDRVSDADTILGRVTVGDTPVGGLGAEEARAAIRDMHERRANEPILVTIEGMEFTLLPREVGYRLDEDLLFEQAMRVGREGGILDQARRWLSATFAGASAEIDAGATFQRESIISTLKLWEPAAIAEPPHEGGISVLAGRVVPVYPKSGTGIDLETTADLIAAEILGDRSPVTAVTEFRVPVLTDEDVDVAVARAERLIDGPVTLSKILPEASVTIPASVLQASISSRVIGPREDPKIELFFQVGPLVQFIMPRRHLIETPPQDAQIVIRPDDVPLILPGSNGVLVDDAALPRAVYNAASSVTRTGPLPVRDGAEPTFTTEHAEALGVRELLYSATTLFVPGGTESNRNRIINIQRMADQVNGAIVMPGEVFSLNEYVGQRTEEGGYRRAGAIIGATIYCCDHPANIGGGVSQFATTLYNAVFWSGLEDVEHQPHSLYISRYPMVREATLGWPTPDLKFRNSTENAVFIKTEYTNNSITVKLFGDNGGIRVEAETSERRDFTEPGLHYEPDPTMPPDEEEEVDDGERGFTASVTRIIYGPDGSERERQTWTWRYDPWPVVIAVHPCKLPTTHLAYDASVECPVQIPSDLIGKTLAQATEALNSIGLIVRQGDPVPVLVEEQHGRVQTHNPAGGTWLDKGREVTVRLGEYTPDD
jgi:vancomycin resistance protein YoaR